jgi:probable rRNA maturation factor
VISIDVEYETPEDLPVNNSEIQFYCNAVLANQGTDGGHATIIFTSDEFLRKMKKKYFNIDVYTDVITFNLEEMDKPLDGEIYISAQRAGENAKKYGVAWKDEIIRLIIHGSLHLLGYDDRTEDEKEIMTSLENKYISIPFSGIFR